MDTDGDMLEDFVRFFQAEYRQLIRTAMFVGATEQEADEAAAAAMEEVCRRWKFLYHRRAYAHHAVISYFLKEKTRSLDRIRQRQVEMRAGVVEGREDPGLTVWEDQEWVAQLLQALPPAQREVMALIVDGFRPTEVADLLGRSPEGVRQSLYSARQRLTSALQRQGPVPQVESRTGPRRRETR